MLILGTSFLFTFADSDDFFVTLIMQSKLFQFDNNNMDCLKRKMNKLIRSLVSIYRHCLSMRVTDEAKQSEEKPQESEMKEDKGSLFLSSAMT